MLSESVSYEIKLPNVRKRLYGSTALHNEPLTGISDKQYSKHILQKYYILSRISCEINYNYKSMINCVEVPLNSNQPKWLSHRQITHITNVTNHHVGFSCFEYDLYLPISALLNAFLYSERNSEMTENYDITSSLASKSRYTNNVIFHINGAMKHNVCSHCIPPSSGQWNIVICHGDTCQSFAACTVRTGTSLLIIIAELLQVQTAIIQSTH